MGQVRKAGLGGGLPYGHSFHTQQVFGAFQSGLQQLSLGRAVEEEVIIVVELADAQIGQGGHAVGGPGSVDVGQYLDPRLAELFVEVGRNAGTVRLGVQLSGKKDKQLAQQHIGLFRVKILF